MIHLVDSVPRYSIGTRLGVRSIHLQYMSCYVFCFLAAQKAYGFCDFFRLHHSLHGNPGSCPTLICLSLRLVVSVINSQIGVHRARTHCIHSYIKRSQLQSARFGQHFHSAFANTVRQQIRLRNRTHATSYVYNAPLTLY